MILSYHETFLRVNYNIHSGGLGFTIWKNKDWFDDSNADVQLLIKKDAFPYDMDNDKYLPFSIQPFAPCLWQS